QVLSRFSSLLREPNGISIVSGPTGSGKTTTLYAALGQQDSLRKNIMTIEDPIEYQLPNIGQIQVKPKIGLTFAAGLRHILRQDPDIVLVGETRDIETAEIALRASLTGHLVFTTLHTNDAPGSVLRLVDMGVEPYLLASCLRGVLAQRLIRRLCEKCKIAVTPSDEDLKALVDDASRIDRKKIFAPVGCPMCLEGYSGRLGLFELLVVDRTMQELIREGHTDGNALRRCGEANGMTTLRTDGISKANDGNTSVLEVINVTG
ncbi:MAG: Flp pilus assembly complex ATPase component TadA, partial [Lentisphaerae bacterium]|nr:Flp pilus assembly complex ATPase component TadA [Lentisphaerota bacterium]